MAQAYTETFPVRYSDCDAYGHVNNAQYLRYMQEAAFGASASVGYTQKRYQELGQAWLTRSTEIEYLRPLVHGDTIHISTWVGDFRRISSRRYYEIRNAATHELAAIANTDWLLIDTQTQRPIAVSDAMITAYQENTLDGSVTEGERREKFPEPPAPPEGIFSIERQVEWRDIDTMHHVNNANYLSFMEECGVRAAAAFGWPMQRLAQELKVGLMARKHTISYNAQAKLGDVLRVSAFLSEVKRSTALRHFRITHAETGEIISQSRTLMFCVNIETGMPMRWPQPLIDDMRANIAQEA